MTTCLHFIASFAIGVFIGAVGLFYSYAPSQDELAQLPKITKILVISLPIAAIAGAVCAIVVAAAAKLATKVAATAGVLGILIHLYGMTILVISWSSYDEVVGKLSDQVKTAMVSYFIGAVIWIFIGPCSAASLGGAT